MDSFTQILAFPCHVLHAFADGCVPPFSFSPVFHHFNVFNFMWVFLVSYSHSDLHSLLLFRGEDSCSNMQWFDPIVLIHSPTLIIFRYYDSRVFLGKYNLFFQFWVKVVNNWQIKWEAIDRGQRSDDGGGYSNYSYCRRLWWALVTAGWLLWGNTTGSEKERAVTEACSRGIQDN